MWEPALFEGEEIVLRAQGSLQEERYSSSWKLGHVYITTNRLFLIQGTKWLFEAPLDRITDLSVVKRGWMLGVRIRQLSVSFESRGANRMRVYIALAEPEKGAEAIKASMALFLAHKKWGYDAGNPGS